MFRITGGKGFHISFENGYTVSVQFGPANYCDHYDAAIGEDAIKCGQQGSTTAECAVWGPDKEMLETEWTPYGVSNRSEPAEVLAILNWAASQGVA